jgi:hypothetical protein
MTTNTINNIFLAAEPAAPGHYSVIRNQNAIDLEIFQISTDNESNHQEENDDLEINQYIPLIVNLFIIN